jgi:hypothetical protein
MINSTKRRFGKLDLFPSSDEGRETPTLLGPLERVDLNHWRCLLSWDFRKNEPQSLDPAEVMRLALSKRLNRVGVSALSPDSLICS